MIRVGVQDLVGTRVEAIVAADLPHFGAEGIRICDAKASQRGDGTAQLENKKGDEDSGPFPFARQEGGHTAESCHLDYDCGFPDRQRRCQ